MAREHLIDIACANYALVEDLYQKYVLNPKSVSDQWIDIFKALEAESKFPKEKIFERGDFYKTTLGEEIKIAHLIDAYRNFGYLAVPVNPIALSENQVPPELQLENLGFKETDLSQSFPTCGLLPKSKAPLLEIIQTLKKIYCSRIGFEYMGLQGFPFEKWIQQKIETEQLSSSLTTKQKQMILELLNKSELFEAFLHTRFPGQKRFSIEGGETFIPMLASVIEMSAILGVSEVVLGMAHRGRLNVLSNILNKSYVEIFSEFDEGYFPDSFEGTGDVKYHKGFLSEVITVHGHSVQLTLTPNPSHLESVDPVVEGQVKAKQIQAKDEKQEKVLGILVHGDAAIAAQGVVYETIQLYKLKGFSTGGTLHIVVNNQVGFTTSPQEGRSTPYCTDISKTFHCPVFHVNAEDPEACVFVASMAAQIRHLFHIDVFIDLNCYRKYGHNEGDEPAFTQPLEYQKIRTKRPIRELYRDQLVDEGTVEKFLAEALEVEFKKSLQEAQRSSKPIQKKESILEEKKIIDPFHPVETAVSKETLRKVTERFCEVPRDFHIHPKLEHLLKERLSMVIKEDKKIDWGMGELLAYATLLWQGVSLRLSGQDSGRGTFSHRHALWKDQQNQTVFNSLNHMKNGQGHADIINSPLSEYGVLGFEYGYSTVAKETLVIWEAQFGDFGNGGQVVIDQYIASGEQKWGQKSNLTLLLPHGYEGQGPEHSSARLERFLELAGHENLWICYPSTPAQFFHLLRRQVLHQLVRPLICLTPKLLLRHPECVSSLEEFEKGSFKEILDDISASKKAKRLIFCSGKIYYDLLALREKEKMDDTAFIRFEQLYPFHEKHVKEIIKSYKEASEFIWAQEEPENMGAWRYLYPLLESLLPRSAKLEYIGRKNSAAPAVGSYVLHKRELAEIFEAITKHKKGSIIQIAHLHRA